MEQMYLVEIFVDKVTIFLTEQDEGITLNKRIVIKAKFGPKVQFIIKEGQLIKEDIKNDTVETDDQGKKKFTRTIRNGRSLLFPSYPDTMLIILEKFPLEIEVWNNDEKDEPIFVGVGDMRWDTHFFFLLKETTSLCLLHESLSIKKVVDVWKECCCTKAGEVHIIVRIFPLGDSIITEYQQVLKDPNTFVYRVNKYDKPSMYECKRVERDDSKYITTESLYETTRQDDPDLIAQTQKKIEICTELQSCGMAQIGTDYICEQPSGSEKTETKKYPDKFRMGDISGPCGNANCALAHKVKNYIRRLESYKKVAGTLRTSEEHKTKKVCGTCSCKDDRYHSDAFPDKVEQPAEKDKCGGCGGLVPPGDSCEDRKNKMFGTNFTPRQSDTHINYMFSTTKMPTFKQSAFGRD